MVVGANNVAGSWPCRKIDRGTVEIVVAGVMRTPDRRCRIEVAERHGAQRLRVWRDGFLVGDVVTLPDLERLLVRLGVDLAQLVED